MTPTPDLIALAERLADATGPILTKWFGAGLEPDDKEDQSPVTRADREAEAAMRAILAESAPHHGVIGEELGRSGEDAELVWVLDPIDGTKAFVVGKPLFGTLIALLYRGRPVLGVIDAPALGDRWIGAAGRATTRSGRPCRARPCADLRRARLSTTGPQYFSAGGSAAFGRVAARSRFTSYGGDCYQYGLLASGSVDVIVEEGLKVWDYAALVPVIEGAGGVVTDWEGRPLHAGSDGRVVATGDPALHAEVIAALAG
jgi:histidinol phosphatase-like enzyme (inositol monophosphatase family)